jgi:hypothetical protein
MRLPKFLLRNIKEALDENNEGEKKMTALFFLTSPRVITSFLALAKVTADCW